MIITKVFPQIFPDELKVADIFPIFKIKYKDGKFSYRPFNPLHVLLRIIEMHK